MDDMFIIYPKIYERARASCVERVPQIFDPARGLRERLALTVGRFFIATGEKLLRLAAPAPQWEKKVV